MSLKIISITNSNQEYIRESTQLVSMAVMFWLNDITVAVPSTSEVQGVGHE